MFVTKMCSEKSVYFVNSKMCIYVMKMCIFSNRKICSYVMKICLSWKYVRHKMYFWSCKCVRLLQKMCIIKICSSQNVYIFANHKICTCHEILFSSNYNICMSATKICSSRNAYIYFFQIIRYVYLSRKYVNELLNTSINI